MERTGNDFTPPPEVLAYYDGFLEESRLGFGFFRLEFERTKELLARVLPEPPARIVDVGGAAGAYSLGLPGGGDGGPPAYAPPARIVDVGGAAGAYSLWLAEAGYEVHLVDASPRLVEEARRRSAGSATRIASLSVADGRRLPQENDSAAAVLVMGPLYHLPSAADRVASLREGFRVLATDGTVVVAAISRYA